jgi:hypothetical protein
MTPRQLREIPKFSNHPNVFRPVQPCPQKYSCFISPQITGVWLPSRPERGALAIVTNVGRDAVDADALLTNGAEADGEVVWS